MLKSFVIFVWVFAIVAASDWNLQRLQNYSRLPRFLRDAQPRLLEEEDYGPLADENKQWPEAPGGGPVGSGGYWHADWENPWFTGCHGSPAARGQTSRVFQHDNFISQALNCLSNCNPSQTIDDVEDSCDGLKCMMFCLAKGTYTDTCIYYFQLGLCKNATEALNQKERDKASAASLEEIEECDVNCDGAGNAHPLTWAATLVPLLMFTLTFR